MSEDITSYVDAVLDTLSEDTKKTINRKDIESEFTKFLDYGVPVEQAKQTLIKKYGGASTTSSGGAATNAPDGPMHIKDISGTTYGITLTGRVIHIAEKEITIKGEGRTIYYGILADETGTIPFTAWNDWQIEKGDVLEINDAYSKEWQGNPQLNFGDRTGVNKGDPDAIPQVKTEASTAKLSELTEGMRNISITGKILTANTRTVNTKNGERTVVSGTILDETGKVQYTCWGEQVLEENKIYTIDSGYVRAWRGIPQYTFDDNCTVTLENDDALPGLAGDLPIHNMSLGLLADKQGGLDITTTGTIIQVKNGSGLIERCPECNRALTEGECQTHGKVKGRPDLRLKLIVDDGTGATTALLNKDLTEDLLSVKMVTLKKNHKDKSPEDITADLTQRVFGKTLTLTGNALMDDYGMTFITREMHLESIDTKKASEDIIKAMEELQ